MDLAPARLAPGLPHIAIDSLQLRSCVRTCGRQSAVARMLRTFADGGLQLPACVRTFADGGLQLPACVRTFAGGGLQLPACFRTFADGGLQLPACVRTFAGDSLQLPACFRTFADGGLQLPACFRTLRTAVCSHQMAPARLRVPVGRVRRHAVLRAGGSGVAAGGFRCRAPVRPGLT
jgi:hypothetical protein